MNELREDCKENIIKLRECLNTFQNTQILSGLKYHLHALHVKSLGMALASGIFLSCILKAFVINKDWIDKEAHEWSIEVYHLAQLAAQYRPLGAMVFIVSLQAACLGAADAATRDMIRALALEYEEVCLGEVQDEPLADLERMQKRFALLEV